MSDEDVIPKDAEEATTAVGSSTASVAEPIEEVSTEGLAVEEAGGGETSNPNPEEVEPAPAVDESKKTEVVSEEKSVESEPAHEVEKNAPSEPLPQEFAVPSQEETPSPPALFSYSRELENSTPIIPVSSSGAALAAKEVIKEVEKPLTEEDKKAIFKERLQSTLGEARRQKHTNYEKHLEEIVSFIRQKGTLVTNQDIEEGLKLSDTTATNRLNELIRRDMVVRLGDQRHAKYRLTAAM